MNLDEKALEAAWDTLPKGSTLISRKAFRCAIRAYLSALPSLPVSELVERLEKDEVYRDGSGYVTRKRSLIAIEAASTLSTLSTRNAELDREVKRLREALFVADDTIMTLHGCFPLDRVSKEDVRLNEAAKFIRSFTSDDYYERKRIVDAFFAALSTSPQGGEHE